MNAFSGGVAAGSGPPHNPDMEARVAVLEQIAKDTKEAIVSLRSEMKELRDDMRSLRSEQRTDSRWLFGTILAVGGAVLGVMAKGFHWL